MKLGPYELGPEGELRGVYEGDARALTTEVPNESVDLIFADPEYDKPSDYRWLAYQALRILKENSPFLVWTNPLYVESVMDVIRYVGWKFRWQFVAVNTAKQRPRLIGKIIPKTNLLLWFDRCGESKMSDYLADGYLAGAWSEPGSHNHPWTKHPGFVENAVRAFSPENAIVFDPFAGGGQVPAACRRTGRYWLAFEIESEYVLAARQEVAHAQVPLFTMQNEFWEGEET